MADNRKYYYLKLKENFFDSDSIVLLEDMKDGILYSNILLKLYLKSLKNGGRSVFLFGVVHQIRKTKACFNSYERNTKTPHDHLGKRLNPYSSFFDRFHYTTGSIACP